MTQEELDALMNGELSLDEVETQEAVTEQDGQVDAAADEDYRVSPKNFWPPPPPSREHQVVSQLDDVTRESEEKASAIFDILDVISSEAGSCETGLKKADEILKQTQAMLATLSERFPSIHSFSDHHAKIGEARQFVAQAIEKQQQIADHTLNAMDIMQFQDIHRQKIERVINVMRALTNYMNKLFESRIDDDKRVSSAIHIAGDTHTELADEDDIEALIAAFGKK
ncbi:MAG: chemotaxis protein [Campylobacterales bacterium]